MIKGMLRLATTSDKKEKPGFDRKISPEEINELPVKKYDGPVRIISSREGLVLASQALRQEMVLGFDTETKPAFAKGQSFPVALLQLAGQDAVYIFQLRHLEFPKMLRDILENSDIIKAGFAPDYDIKQLKALGEFDPAGFVDLGTAAKREGIKNHGLRGLAAVLLGFRISKQAQRSNWSRMTLSPSQISYAATDAWVSREIFLRLKEDGCKL
jgi:ribonuclease D